MLYKIFLENGYLDVVLNMSDNSNSNNSNDVRSNNANIPNDNIPRNRDNPDIPRLIRYLSGNVGALMCQRPMTRAIGLTVANAGNIIADVLTNEEKANYWIDQ